MTMEQDSNTILGGGGGDISGFGGFKKPGSEFSDQQSSSYEQPQNGFGEKLADLIVKISGGLIKTETQAYYVILGLVALAIIISLFLFFGGGRSESPPQEEIFRVTPPSTPIQ